MHLKMDDIRHYDWWDKNGPRIEETTREMWEYHVQEVEREMEDLVAA